MLGFGFACAFHWDFFGNFFATSAIAGWAAFYDLGYLDYGPWGGHLNHIHFSHEERVARNQRKVKATLKGYFD